MESDVSLRQDLGVCVCVYLAIHITVNIDVMAIFYIAEVNCSHQIYIMITTSLRNFECACCLVQISTGLDVVLTKKNSLIHTEI